MSLDKAVFILGPTASGKSNLALEVAVAQKLSIVNMDSLQIYKGLKIGSALPSREDMKLADHHLYAYVDKGEKWTAAQYVLDVKNLLKKEKSLHTPLFCGGSGFYIQALEKGMYEMPAMTDSIRHEVKTLIEDKGWAGAYEWVLAQDPGLSRTVHLNDQYRIRRAIEIIKASGQTPSQLQNKLTESPLGGVPIVKVALYAEKNELLKRVELRAQKMLEMGFVEEVRELIGQGYGEWAPLKSVGYNEVCQYLSGDMNLDELPLAIVQATMKLIKKQLTWFKRDTEIRWFHVDKLSAAKEYILSELAP